MSSAVQHCFLQLHIVSKLTNKRILQYAKSSFSVELRSIICIFLGKVSHTFLPVKALDYFGPPCVLNKKTITPFPRYLLEQFLCLAPFSDDPANGHWHLIRVRHSLAFEPLPVRLCLTGFAHYNEFGV